MTDLQLNYIFNHLLTDIVEIDIRSIRLGYSREASHDYLFFKKSFNGETFRSRV